MKSILKSQKKVIESVNPSFFERLSDECSVCQEMSQDEIYAEEDSYMDYLNQEIEALRRH